MSETAVSHNNTSSPMSPIRYCPFCNAVLHTDEAVCSCGRAIVERKRCQERPQRIELRRVPASQGSLMSEYTIWQSQVDGSLICNCPSFESQNNSTEELPFGNCKHIRGLDRELLDGAARRFEEWVGRNDGRIVPPSRNQRAQLSQFEVNVHDRLSYSQAYFIIANALERQGIKYWEYFRIMENNGYASILPKLEFAVEIECYTKRSLGGTDLFMQKVLESGLRIERDSTRSHELAKCWKIRPDGSLSSSYHSNNLDGIEVISPPLYGAYGFEQIAKITAALNTVVNEETLSLADRTCGLHVHINARRVPDEKLLTLLKMYRAVEKPLIWGLIPASRRNNTYALNITDEYIEQCARCGPRSFSRYGSDHYHAVSYGAMSEQESVEIRWAHGTTQYERIVNWVIFHLKFIHSVYRGMNLESINDITTIEELLDRIGLSEETGTSPIVKARKWCLKRFYEDIDGGRWPQTAWYTAWRDRHQDAPAATVDSEVEAPCEPPRQAVAPVGWGNLLEIAGNYIGGNDTPLAVAYTRYKNRAEAMSSRQDNMFPPNDIRNLAARKVRGKLTMQTITDGIAEGRWMIRSRNNRWHHVLYNGGLMSCTCGHFRGKGYCNASVSIARYLEELRWAIEIYREG